jgi:hypothetical protein
MIARIEFASRDVASRQLVRMEKRSWLARKISEITTDLMVSNWLRIFVVSPSDAPEFRAGRNTVWRQAACGSHPHYRGCRLRLADARPLLILAVLVDAGRVLRLRPGRTSRGGCSGSGLAGCGCVLRTASANIRCKSAFVGVKGLVILSLFLFRLRGFPGQGLSLQSLIIPQEGFLLDLVFCRRRPFAGAVKRGHEASRRSALR